MMGKEEERAHGALGEFEASKPGQTKHVFDEPATLREPAAPRVPRVMQPSTVSVIPLPNEEQARPTEPPATLQEACEATDALLHDILEEDEAGAPAAPPKRTPGQSPQEEDWPSELHSIYLPED
jgi:hypothetical protein